MASILKVGNSWRVQIRRKGLPKLVKTFTRHEEAQTFAQESEAQKRLRGMPLEVGALPRITATQFIGIYFLFKGETCVYVGQSINVHARVRMHRGIIDFDEYAWMPVQLHELDATEKKYIRAISPIHNTTHKLRLPKTKSKSIAESLFSAGRNGTNVLPEDILNALNPYRTRT